jgi:hypothetical protein
MFEAIVLSLSILLGSYTTDRFSYCEDQHGFRVCYECVFDGIDAICTEVSRTPHPFSGEVASLPEKQIDPERVF